MATNLTPTPYVAIPTDQWDGVDGNWSTFRISVGSQPSQNFRVLVSTLAGAPWVPVPEGCVDEGQDCPSSRGVEPFQGQPSDGFQRNPPWDDLSSWGLDLEDRLNFSDGGGYYGRDTIRLGFGDDTDALEVNGTQVVAFAELDYWMGFLGVGDVNTTMNDQEPIKSFIHDLNDTRRIPSLSYGYTAGAHYRNTKVPGSLVIGGYDESRSQPASFNFSFADNLQQYLVVGLQSIDTNFSLRATGSERLVTNGGHYTLIDSSVSQLWLPEDICNNFAAAFGLTYDDERNYYLINDTMHSRLLKEKPTIRIRVGKAQNIDDKDSVQIELPYAAFDHSITHRAYRNNTRYFPIRRAMNYTQYTIGRVFLQEAYLTVDYERSKFSLAQARFDDPMPAPDIRTIHSIHYVSPATPSSGLSGGAKAGIAIGVIVGFFIAIGLVYFYYWRPRRQKQAHMKRPSIASQAPTYQSSAEPPPHYYGETKPYNPWATMSQEQQAEHEQQQYLRHHSVSEMPAGADGQARRPELDGSGVGGESYELAAPLKEGKEDAVVYEMGVEHKPEATVSQGNGRVAAEEGESQASEQRPARRRKSSLAMPSPP